jgi:hypothetical protein
MENIKNQIINSYLSQQLMVQETPREMDVPSVQELEDFKNYVKIWMEVDNNIKKMQAVVKERNQVKKEISSKILAFMARFNIEDLNTKEGTLRCKVTTVKEPFTESKMKKKLQATYEPGMQVDELSKNLFDRKTISKQTLKRLK